MNSDAGGKSALGEELGPSAWAVVAHGRVQKPVVRADVADEFVCSWRESDPEATAVPLYSWAAVESAVTAERERLRSALEWYADEARACAKNSHTGNHAAPQALLASVTVLALDGGQRADEALKA